jgi:hypothetical protein
MTKGRDRVADALVLGSIGGGAAAISAAGSPALAAVVAAGSALMQLGYGWMKERTETRWTKWTAAYIGGDAGADVAAFEKDLEAIVTGDAAGRDLVIENVRALADALSDVVVPALAKLTRDYISKKQGADAFFRGLRRILSDVSEDEYVALRDLVRRVCDLDVGTKETVTLLNAAEGAYMPDSSRTLKYRVELPPRPPDGVHRPPGPEHALVAFGEVPHKLRLIHLLKTNGLAEDPATPTWGSANGPHAISLDRAMMARLRDVLE